MSKLSVLPAIAAKPKRRIGRGIGSTAGGHTSTRGTKGQLARQGAKVPLWFEGGQLPLIKRLPMLRGKGRLKPTTKVITLTLSDLNNVTADVVTVDSLKLEKVIPSDANRVKVIATGTVTKKVALKGIAVTDSARTQIETVGGTVEN
jgi:large subunit ribosomal protein L15